MTNDLKRPVDPLAVPIPISDGTIVMVYLPPELSEADADKIARVVRAMATPDAA
jgi:hypothetical protein